MKQTIVAFIHIPLLDRYTSRVQ